VSKGVKTHKFFKNYWCWPKGSRLTWIVRKPRHHKFWPWVWRWLHIWNRWWFLGFYRFETHIF